MRVMDRDMIQDGSGGRFFSWTRPRSYWDVMGTHFPLALVSGLTLLVSAWVPLKALPLVPCTFLRFTHYPCPFCGLTRSFWAMAHGDWAFAANNAPLACLIYLATAAVFAWNAAGLLLGIRISRGPRLGRGAGWGRAMAVVGLLLLILNWAYRLGHGLR